MNIQELALSACACMGPMYDEPHCYCEMKRRELPLNTVAREADRKKLAEALDTFFKENARDTNLTLDRKSK